MTARPDRRAARRWLAASLSSLLMAGLPAQVPDRGEPVVPPRGAQGQDAFGPAPPEQRDPLDPTWVSPPKPPPFEGFPVFPSRLSGYGRYPVPGRTGGQGSDALPLPSLPSAPPEAPGWPGWLRLQQKEPLPFAVDLGLLVQHADRVWWRAEAESPYVPLFFHDKLRTLKPGAEIQVRQAGEFELLLHTSTRFIAQGPTDVQIVALTATSVELDVRHFTRLRLQTKARDHVLRLPDGSQLSITAEPGEGESEGPVRLLLQRADEPSRYGGRATIFNPGPRAVLWRHAFGETRLAPDHRVTIFLQPPATKIAAPLAPNGGRATVEDASLSFAGADDADVSWCGARFRVGAGQSVQIDPLQGEPFAPPSPNGSGNRETP